MQHDRSTSIHLFISWPNIFLGFEDIDHLPSCPTASYLTYDYDAIIF